MPGNSREASPPLSDTKMSTVVSHMLFSCSASITVWMPRSSSVYIAPATLYVSSTVRL